MRRSIARLWAGIGEAEEAIERLLVDRLYTELDKLLAETSVGTLPVPVLRRMAQKTQESSDKRRKGIKVDSMSAAAGLAPDLLRKVLERLEWGPAELAVLNLTEDLAWCADGERSEVARLLVKLKAEGALYYPDPAAPDGDQADQEEKGSPPGPADVTADRELPTKSFPPASPTPQSPPGESVCGSHSVD